MLTLERVVEIARALSRGAPSSDAVARARQQRAALIAETLAFSGFPETAEKREELSLAPLLFQEANYDNIGWMHQHEQLRQLTGLFDLDFLVQSGGCLRAQADSAQFADYVEGVYRAIRRQRLQS
jgi:hypothetical protein